MRKCKKEEPNQKQVQMIKELWLAKKTNTEALDILTKEYQFEWSINKLIKIQNHLKEIGELPYSKGTKGRCTTRIKNLSLIKKDPPKKETPKKQKKEKNENNIVDLPVIPETKPKTPSPINKEEEKPKLPELIIPPQFEEVTTTERTTVEFSEDDFDEETFFSKTEAEEKKLDRKVDSAVKQLEKEHPEIMALKEYSDDEIDLT